MEDTSNPSEMQVDEIPQSTTSEVKTAATKSADLNKQTNQELVNFAMVSVPIAEIVEMERNSLSNEFLDSIPLNIGTESNKSMLLASQKVVPMDVEEDNDKQVQEIRTIDRKKTDSSSSEPISASSDVVSNKEAAPATKVVASDAVTTKSDDIVMLLSDSDDEDAKKPHAVEKKEDEKDSSIPTEPVVETTKPLTEGEKENAESNAPAVAAAVADDKNNKNCDDDVIMLDDSPENSEAEMSKKTEAPIVNPVPSNVDEVKSEESSKTAEPLRLIEKLVEECYQLEKEAAATPSPPTDATDNAAVTASDAAVKPDESQNKEPSVRLVGMEKLLDDNARKAQENWECINFECKSKKLSAFCKAPLFALNHFNVPKKVTRPQFICEMCFEKCVDEYERLGTVLVNHQPLLMEKLPIRPELVEILDSSEEEDNGGSNTKYIDNTKPLPLDTLTLLEDHFEETLNETLKRIKIDVQVSWTNQVLKHKVDKNQVIAEELDGEIKTLQKLADSMYEKLYKNTNFVIEELPPFDLNTNKQMHMAGPHYPPFGEVVYPPVDLNSLYYAVRAKLLTTWIPCKVTEILDGLVDGKKSYKVRFLRTKGVLSKTVPGNHLAYGTPPAVRLVVGTRVIALFTMEPGSDNFRTTFFPGIIAEPLQAYNRWRYLIFFDDGYAQYVTPDNIRLICSPSANCWDDIYPDSSEFIKSYLNQYKTQRPMVQVRRGQRMITEWNGEWTYARVNDMDGSLVQMFFENAKRTEWIYRGSTRLGPLYKDRQIQKHSVSSGKRNEPFVEYMSVDEDGKNKNSQTLIQKSLPAPKPPPAAPPAAPPAVPPAAPPAVPPVAPSVAPALPSQTQAPKPSQPSQPPAPEEKRSVAKKSVSAPPRPQPTVQHMNNSTIYVEEDNRPKGKVVYYTAKKHMPPRKYVRHNCGVGCLYEVKHNLSSYSPLAKPLLSGWERKILRNKSKKVVVYRSPCGRNLRNMSELHKYLRATKCSLNVDNFDFDFSIHCLAEYVIDTCIVQKHDLSDGCEPMVVPCVNYYDNTMPPPCVYSAKRVPNEGVNLNLDNDFLCGCECEDDCMDKNKCGCWKLTLEGAQFGNPNTPADQVGYDFKRLPNPVPTGIYECNSRCKCSKTCLNRVAQHPLQMKLQVFKTVSRGWGLRCLNDVPKGSFICVYAGDLLTEQNANIAGDNYGDEYFAELDYIEVVESLKEGYEPGVMDDDYDDDEYEGDKTKDDSDDDEYVATVSHGSRQTRYNTRHSVDVNNGKKVAEPPKLKLPSSGSNSDEEDAQRQLISFVPNADSTSFENNSSGRYKSIRKFYGKNESVFIMDAKKLGNIGRYFNHSCSPNLFVQNVFVDTHDLRFPWVAFFALSHIRAGSELTWNYNYDVGSVPGKVMFCECGAVNCRGRLL